MVRYPSSLIGEPSVTGTQPLVDAERTFPGCPREDVRASWRRNYDLTSKKCC
jgi:hypothetical protein